MSPRSKARLAAAFYLLTILTGLLAQGYISARLVVSGDAAATAANILHNESLFRLGFAVYLVEMASQIAMTVLFYEVLKPAGRTVSLHAAAISLVACGIKIVSRVFFFAPLLLVARERYLDAFNPAQTDALALLFLQINDEGAAIALVFFGVYALLKGYLLYRSGFVPRVLGVLTIIGGAGWIAFVWPPFGYRLFPIIGALGLLGALANIGWFLVVGVDDERWKQRNAESASSIWR